MNFSESPAMYGGKDDGATLAAKRGALDLLVTIGLLPAGRIRT
jgi:hypothetical protein